MNAKTSEINSSHLPFISHPQKVAALIEEAATATAATATAATKP
jgi:hypothetical protein